LKKNYDNHSPNSVKFTAGWLVGLLVDTLHRSHRSVWRHMSIKPSSAF